MGYDPFNFTPGGSGNQEVWANDSCDNYDYLITGLYSTWGTGNSQIATANMNQISAVAAGSTYDLAGGWIPADGGADEHHHCPNVWDGPSGGVDVCQDGLPLLIQEYSTYGADFTPSCIDFTYYTNSQPSTHFSFNELNVSDISRNEYPHWAILRNSMLQGLESTRSNYNNQPLSLNSGYRSPYVNSLLGGATGSRHIHGDGVDITSDSTTWQALHDAAKLANACVEPQSTSGSNHIHADWRGACPTGW